jgi:hypothetical protein
MVSAAKPSHALPYSTQGLPPPPPPAARRVLVLLVPPCRTVEVFDPQRGSWPVLGAQLHSERKYCAAASLGGRLLVLGGMNEARRRCVWGVQTGSMRLLLGLDAGYTSGTCKGCLGIAG